MIERLSREQGAILTLATQTVCGPVDDALKLASRLMERPVLLHELGSGDVSDEIQRLVLPLLELVAPSMMMPAPVWPGGDSDESPPDAGG